MAFAKAVAGRGMALPAGVSQQPVRVRMQFRESDGLSPRVRPQGIEAERKVRASQGKTLGNAQRERSLESATESRPPDGCAPYW